MKSEDKKMTVLHQLSQESEPIELSTLLENLGTDYSERTVRRWLMEMVEKGLVTKSGQKKSTKYHVNNRIERKSSHQANCFSLENQQIIDLVRQPIYLREPITYADHWIESYEPNITFYIPKDSRDHLEKAGKRSSGKDPAGTYAHQIFNRLLIDLSFNSSRLEGNTYSLADTQKLLFEGTSAEGKLDIEKLMILNHKEAIRYLVDNAFRLEISERIIFTLHFLLADGLIEPQLAGRIRDHGIRVGGSSYIPFETKKQLDGRMLRILEKAKLINNPYEQSFFLLVHISYLQAFTDINKRTARLSANIPLIKANLVPLSFNDIDKDDYISAMIAIYELQKIGPLLDIYLFSYMRTCAIYDETVKMMGFDEIRVRYRQQRRAILRNIILNQLNGTQLTDYVTAQTTLLIKEEDRSHFFEDILEDLRDIDSIRIVGLGVTLEQLNAWLALQNL